MRRRASAPRAGGSATQMYHELSNAWRRRNRRLFTIAGTLFLLIGAGSWILQTIWPPFAWFSGLICGSLLGLYMFARLSPPAWIENWQDGAWGEEATAKALKPLVKAGWTLLNDLDSGTGNIDHLLVGPPGVFMLDSKRWHGIVHVTADRATVQRRELGTLRYNVDDASRMRWLASEVSRRLRESSRVREWVRPVIVVWGDFPQQCAGDTVTYLHGDNLASWLESQPGRLTQPQQDRLAQHLRDNWTPRNATTAPR